MCKGKSLVLVLRKPSSPLRLIFFTAKIDKKKKQSTQNWFAFQDYSRNENWDSKYLIQNMQNKGFTLAPQPIEIGAGKLRISLLPQFKLQSQPWFLFTSRSHSIINS